MLRINATSDNTDFPIKIEIRGKVLGAIGAPVHVLDLFCGSGKMFEKCYGGKVASYKGLDKKNIHDPNLCEIADNKRWVKANSIADYNLFDLDAYGGPWDLFYIMTHTESFMSKHARVGVVITDGTPMAFKVNGISAFMRHFLRLPRGMKIPCIGRHYLYAVSLVLNKICKDAKCSLVKIGNNDAIPYQFSRIGMHESRNVCYMGFVMEKTVA